MRSGLALTEFTTILLVGCAGLIPPVVSPTSLPAAATIVTLPHPTLTPFQPATQSPIPEPTPSPGQSPSATPAEEPLPTQAPPDRLTITIVYNNIASDPRLMTDWGFGAYIEYHDQVVLFDTGANGATLLQNMQTLGIDPASVQFVVISHAHQDHTGGLAAFLAVSSEPPVYLLRSFGDSLLHQTRLVTEVVEATPGLEITTDMLTTGEVSGGIPEQALVIRTQQGLVVVTGCAHPGIVRIVERAIELTGESVYLVMGGFHMSGSTRTEITHILEEFRRLGVQRVAPSHCTGDLAIRMFAEEYGEDFLESGAGSIITIDH